MKKKLLLIYLVSFIALTGCGTKENPYEGKIYRLSKFENIEEKIVFISSENDDDIASYFYYNNCYTCYYRYNKIKYKAFFEFEKAGVAIYQWDTDYYYDDEISYHASSGKELYEWKYDNDYIKVYKGEEIIFALKNDDNSLLDIETNRKYYLVEDYEW